MSSSITIGVLALQGAFLEHIKLLRQAALEISNEHGLLWHFIEVRKVQELDACDGLIIPGGESTTVALVAARSGLLESLRAFVKYRIQPITDSDANLEGCRVYRKPTWGTCAGLILLAESANRTKQGGQDLIGGLDVRVNRNYFGRQTESFKADLALPFLDANEGSLLEKPKARPFPGVFIRAPVVEKLLPVVQGEQISEDVEAGMVIAPQRSSIKEAPQRKLPIPVDVMGILPGRSKQLIDHIGAIDLNQEVGDIVAVRQDNVFGTSFHPELTEDVRIHVWWLQQVQRQILSKAANGDVVGVTS